MTQDSTALLMSQADTVALDVLSHASQAIIRANEQAKRLYELELKAMEDADTIAALRATVESLTQDLAITTEARDSAYDREAQLRADLADTQAKLVTEQRLAGQHWNDLQRTERELDTANTALANLGHQLADTGAALKEAEGKLAHFRDILGMPHPVPQQPVNPVEPAQTPSLGSGESPRQDTQAVAEVTGCYIGLDMGGADLTAEATFPDDVQTSDPHIASAISNWYDGN